MNFFYTNAISDPLIRIESCALNRNSLQHKQGQDMKHFKPKVAYDQSR